jgi:hypothetical protein
VATNSAPAPYRWS